MRAAIAIAGCLALVLVAGCGGKSDPTPAACLNPSGSYLAALADAPAAVTLAGDVPISECLAENQQAGDLARVGESMLEAATKLNAEARATPGDAANLQLGYLLGAAQRGADTTEGIHTDLIRRLSVAARYSPGGPLAPAFLATYREGFDAGRAGG